MTTTNDTTATAFTAAHELALTGAGAVVWWDFENSRVTPETMRSILKEVGDATVVPDIKPRNAVVRAAREWRRRTHRAEIAFEDANEIVIGILHRENPGAKEVAWKQIDQVTFDLNNDAWSNPGTTDEAAAYVGHANILRAHLDHQWIRPFIVDRFNRMAALPLRRRSGGFHFIGNQFFADIEKTAAIVGKIGSCSLNVMPVTQSAATQAAVTQAATSTTRESLGELRKRLDAWRDSARKVSTSSADNVLAAFADLNDRCGLYADAMAISLSDLQEEIAAAAQDARDLIDESAARSGSSPSKEYEPGDKMHWSHRKKIRTMRVLIGENVGEFSVDSAEIMAAGFAKSAANTPLFWNRVEGMGCGAAAAYCGFSTKAKSKAGAMTLTFTPIEGYVAPPIEDEQTDEAPKPKAKAKKAGQADAGEAIEQTADTVVVPDKQSLQDDINDARSDLRESLANMHVKDVRVRYDGVFGSGNHSGVKKAAMIEKIVDVIA